MRPSKRTDLGKVLTIMNQASADLQEDPMNDYAGFAPDPTPLLDQIAQDYGFANTRHVYAAVRDRTTSKWAQFHCQF